MFFLVCNFTLSPTSCSQLSPSLPSSSSTYNEYLLSVFNGFFVFCYLSSSSLFPSSQCPCFSLSSLCLGFLVIFLLRCVSRISLFQPFYNLFLLLTSVVLMPHYALCLAPFPLHSLSPYTPFSCFPLTSSHIAASYLL